MKWMDLRDNQQNCRRNQGTEMNDQPSKTYNCWPVGLLACFPSLKTRQTPAHLQLLWKTVTQAPIFGRIATPAQGMPGCARHVKPMQLGWRTCQMSWLVDETWWNVAWFQICWSSKWDTRFVGLLLQYLSLVCHIYLHVIFLLSPVEMPIRGLYQFSDSVAYFVNGQCFVASIHWVVTYSNPAVLKKTESNSQPLTLPTALRITLEVPTK